MAQIKKLGVLMMGNEPVKVPQNPVWNGDVTAYTSGEITIRDSELGDGDNMLIPWVEIHDGGKTILIADRNLIVNFSYDEMHSDMKMTAGKFVSLCGRKYILRGCTDAEWVRYILNTGGFDELPIRTNVKVHDSLWHWKGIYSVCSSPTPDRFASFRGYSAAAYWDTYNPVFWNINRGGLRPVLILCDGDGNDEDVLHGLAVKRR